MCAIPLSGQIKYFYRKIKDYTNHTILYGATISSIAQMNEALTSFYFQKPEPQQSCLLALRDIILNYHKSIEETLNYGMPLFVYNGKRLCYLWVDKKTLRPYILMVDGDKINHPMLEKGSRNRMKVLIINPNEDIPVPLIYEIFDMAAKLLD